MTVRLPRCASALRISSATPSEKYAWRGSPLRLANGRTAMLPEADADEELNSAHPPAPATVTAATAPPASAVRRDIAGPEMRTVGLAPTLPAALHETITRKWGVAELSVFGSVLRPDFRSDSDIDFLVTFKPDAPVLGFAFYHMEEELRALVSRNVDLITRKGIERSRNWIRRRNILSSARPIYVG